MEETAATEKAQEKPFRSRYSVWLRTISLTIVIAFLLQDFASAEGGTPLWSEVTPAKTNDTRPNLNASLNKITIPNEAGLTRKVVAKSGEDVIINIQDAHSKLGAQESITSILDNLVRNYNLNLIALEGASDLVDTSLVSSFPIQEVREKTGRFLMKEGKISAGEFYSMISEDPVKLYGVDDPELYKSNLEVFKFLIENKLKIRAELKALKQVLSELENRVYSQELRELSSHKLLHKNGEIKFTEYWEMFSRLAREKGVDYSRYTNLKKLADTVELEKAIDFKKAQSERDALIEELSHKLPKPELEKLVFQSLQFKQNKITPGAFHYFLSQVSQGTGIKALEYKNVILYSKYVVLYEDIDLVAIFDEVESFENDLREKFFKNEDERQLASLTHRAGILSSLLDTTLTDKDYSYFEKNSSLCEISAIREGLETLAMKYRSVLGERVNFNVLQTAIPSAEEFYRLAQARNKALLDNTMKRMKSEGVHVAALITGGFHSEGIAKLMDEEKLSYLVVMPKFDEKSGDRPYIAILTQKPQEYEEQFKDSDFYLAVAPLFERNSLIWGDDQTRPMKIATIAGLLAVARSSVGNVREIQKIYAEALERSGNGEWAQAAREAEVRKEGDAYAVYLSGVKMSVKFAPNGVLDSIQPVVNDLVAGAVQLTPEQADRVANQLRTALEIIESSKGARLSNEERTRIASKISTISVNPNFKDETVQVAANRLGLGARLSSEDYSLIRQMVRSLGEGKGKPSPNPSEVAPTVVSPGISLTENRAILERSAERGKFEPRSLNFGERLVKFELKTVPSREKGGLSEAEVKAKLAAALPLASSENKSKNLSEAEVKAVFGVAMSSTPSVRRGGLSEEVRAKIAVVSLPASGKAEVSEALSKRNFLTRVFRSPFLLKVFSAVVLMITSMGASAAEIVKEGSVYIIKVLPGDTLSAIALEIKKLEGIGGALYGHNGFLETFLIKVSPHIADADKINTGQQMTAKITEAVQPAITVANNAVAPAQNVAAQVSQAVSQAPVTGTPSPLSSLAETMSNMAHSVFDLASSIISSVPFDTFSQGNVIGILAVVATTLLMVKYRVPITDFVLRQSETAKEKFSASGILTTLRYAWLDLRDWLKTNPLRFLHIALVMFVFYGFVKEAPQTKAAPRAALAGIIQKASSVSAVSKATEAVKTAPPTVPEVQVGQAAVEAGKEQPSVLTPALPNNPVIYEGDMQRHLAALSKDARHNELQRMLWDPSGTYWKEKNQEAPTFIIYSKNPDSVYAPVRTFEQSKAFIDFIFSRNVIRTRIFTPPTDVLGLADVSQIETWPEITDPRELDPDVLQGRKIYVYVEWWDLSGKEPQYRSGVLDGGKKSAEEALRLSRIFVEGTKIKREVVRLLAIQDTKQQASEIQSSQILEPFKLQPIAQAQPQVGMIVQMDSLGNIVEVEGSFVNDNFQIEKDPEAAKVNLVFRSSDGKTVKKKKLVIWPYDQQGNYYMFSEKIEKKGSLTPEDEEEDESVKTTEKTDLSGRVYIVGRNYLEHLLTEREIRVLLTQNDLKGALRYKDFLEKRMGLEALIAVGNAIAPGFSAIAGGAIARLALDLTWRPNDMLPGEPTQEKMTKFFAEYYALRLDPNRSFKDLTDAELNEKLKEIHEAWGQDPESPARKAAMSDAEARLRSLSPQDMQRLYEYTIRRKDQLEANFLLQIIGNAGQIAVGNGMVRNEMLRSVLGAKYVSFTGEVGLPIPSNIFGASVSLQTFFNEVAKKSRTAEEGWERPLLNVSEKTKINFYIRGFPLRIFPEHSQQVRVIQAMSNDFAWQARDGYVTDSVTTYSEEEFRMLSKVVVGKIVPVGKVVIENDEKNKIQLPIYLIPDENGYRIVVLGIKGAQKMAAEAERDLKQYDEWSKVMSVGGVIVSTSVAGGTEAQETPSGLYMSHRNERRDYRPAGFTWDQMLIVQRAMLSGDMRVVERILDFYNGYYKAATKDGGTFVSIPKGFNVFTKEPLAGEGPSIAMSASLGLNLMRYLATMKADGLSDTVRYREYSAMLQGIAQFMSDEQEKSADGGVRDNKPDEGKRARQYGEPNALAYAFFKNYRSLDPSFENQFQRINHFAKTKLWDPVAGLMRQEAGKDLYSADAQSRWILAAGPEWFMDKENGLGMSASEFMDYLIRVQDRFSVRGLNYVKPDGTMVSNLTLFDLADQARATEKRELTYNADTGQWMGKRAGFLEVTAEFVRVYQEVAASFRSHSQKNLAVELDKRAGEYLAEIERVKYKGLLPQSTVPGINSGFGWNMPLGSASLGSLLQYKLTMGNANSMDVSPVTAVTLEKLPSATLVTEEEFRYPRHISGGEKAQESWVNLLADLRQREDLLSKVRREGKQALTPDEATTLARPEAQRPEQLIDANRVDGHEFSYVDNYDRLVHVRFVHSQEKTERSIPRAEKNRKEAENLQRAYLTGGLILNHIKVTPDGRKLIGSPVEDEQGNRVRTNPDEVKRMLNWVNQLRDRVKKVSITNKEYSVFEYPTGVDPKTGETITVFATVIFPLDGQVENTEIDSDTGLMTQSVRQGKQVYTMSTSWTVTRYEYDPVTKVGTMSKTYRNASGDAKNPVIEGGVFSQDRTLKVYLESLSQSVTNEADLLKPRIAKFEIDHWGRSRIAIYGLLTQPVQTVYFEGNDKKLLRVEVLRLNPTTGGLEKAVYPLTNASEIEAAIRDGKWVDPVLDTRVEGPAEPVSGDPQADRSYRAIFRTGGVILSQIGLTADGNKILGAPIEENGKVIRTDRNTMAELLNWIDRQSPLVRAKIAQDNYSDFEYQAGKTGEKVFATVIFPLDAQQIERTAVDPDTGLETRNIYRGGQLVEKITTQTITRYQYDDPKSKIEIMAETYRNTSGHLDNPTAGKLLFKSTTVKIYKVYRVTNQTSLRMPRVDKFEENYLTGTTKLNTYGWFSEPIRSIDVKTKRVEVSRINPMTGRRVQSDIYSFAEANKAVATILANAKLVKEAIGQNADAVRAAIEAGKEIKISYGADQRIGYTTDEDVSKVLTTFPQQLLDQQGKPIVKTASSYFEKRTNRSTGASEFVWKTTYLFEAGNPNYRASITPDPLFLGEEISHGGGQKKVIKIHEYKPDSSDMARTAIYEYLEDAAVGTKTVGTDTLGVGTLVDIKSILDRESVPEKGPAFPFTVKSRWDEFKALHNDLNIKMVLIQDNRTKQMRYEIFDDAHGPIPIARIEQDLKGSGRRITISVFDENKKEILEEYVYGLDEKKLGQLEARSEVDKKSEAALLRLVEQASLLGNNRLRGLIDDIKVFRQEQLSPTGNVVKIEATAFVRLGQPIMMIDWRKRTISFKTHMVAGPKNIPSEVFGITYNIDLDYRIKGIQIGPDGSVVNLPDPAGITITENPGEPGVPRTILNFDANTFIAAKEHRDPQVGMVTAVTEGRAEGVNKFTIMDIQKMRDSLAKDPALWQKALDEFNRRWTWITYTENDYSQTVTTPDGQTISPASQEIRGVPGAARTYPLTRNADGTLRVDHSQLPSESALVTIGWSDQPKEDGMFVVTIVRDIVSEDVIRGVRGDGKPAQSLERVYVRVLNEYGFELLTQRGVAPVGATLRDRFPGFKATLTHYGFFKGQDDLRPNQDDPKAFDGIADYSAVTQRRGAHEYMVSTGINDVRLDDGTILFNTKQGLKYEPIATYPDETSSLESLRSEYYLMRQTAMSREGLRLDWVRGSDTRAINQGRLAAIQTPDDGITFLDYQPPYLVSLFHTGLATSSNKYMIGDGKKGDRASIFNKDDYLSNTPTQTAKITNIRVMNTVDGQPIPVAEYRIQVDPQREMRNIGLVGQVITWDGGLAVQNFKRHGWGEEPSDQQLWFDSLHLPVRVTTQNAQGQDVLHARVWNWPDPEHPDYSWVYRMPEDTHLRPTISIYKQGTEIMRWEDPYAGGVNPDRAAYGLDTDNSYLDRHVILPGIEALRLLGWTDNLRADFEKRKNGYLSGIVARDREFANQQMKDAGIPEELLPTTLPSPGALKDNTPWHQSWLTKAVAAYAGVLMIFSIFFGAWRKIANRGEKKTRQPSKYDKYNDKKFLEKMQEGLRALEISAETLKSYSPDGKVSEFITKLKEAHPNSQQVQTIVAALESLQGKGILTNDHLKKTMGRLSTLDVGIHSANLYILYKALIDEMFATKIDEAFDSIDTNGLTGKNRDEIRSKILEQLLVDLSLDPEYLDENLNIHRSDRELLKLQLMDRGLLESNADETTVEEALNKYYLRKDPEGVKTPDDLRTWVWRQMFFLPIGNTGFMGEMAGRSRLIDFLLRRANELVNTGKGDQVIPLVQAYSKFWQTIIRDQGQFRQSRGKLLMLRDLSIFLFPWRPDELFLNMDLDELYRSYDNPVLTLENELRKFERSLPSDVKDASKVQMPDNIAGDAEKETQFLNGLSERLNKIQRLTQDEMDISQKGTLKTQAEREAKKQEIRQKDVRQHVALIFKNAVLEKLDPAIRRLEGRTGWKALSQAILFSPFHVTRQGWEEFFLTWGNEEMAKKIRNADANKPFQVLEMIFSAFLGAATVLFQKHLWSNEIPKGSSGLSTGQAMKFWVMYGLAWFTFTSGVSFFLGLTLLGYSGLLAMGLGHVVLFYLVAAGIGALLFSAFKTKNTIARVVLLVTATASTAAFFTTLGSAFIFAWGASSLLMLLFSIVSLPAILNIGFGWVGLREGLRKNVAHVRSGFWAFLTNWPAKRMKDLYQEKQDEIEPATGMTYKMRLWELADTLYDRREISALERDGLKKGEFPKIKNPIASDFVRQFLNIIFMEKAGLEPWEKLLSLTQLVSASEDASFYYSWDQVLAAGGMDGVQTKLYYLIHRPVHSLEWQHLIDFLEKKYSSDAAKNLIEQLKNLEQNTTPSIGAVNDEKTKAEVNAIQKEVELWFNRRQYTNFRLMESLRLVVMKSYLNYAQNYFYDEEYQTLRQKFTGRRIYRTAEDSKKANQFLQLNVAVNASYQDEFEAYKALTAKKEILTNEEQEFLEKTEFYLGEMNKKIQVILREDGIAAVSHYDSEGRLVKFGPLDEVRKIVKEVEELESIDDSLDKVRRVIKEIEELEGVDKSLKTIGEGSVGLGVTGQPIDFPGIALKFESYVSDFNRILALINNEYKNKVLAAIKNSEQTAKKKKELESIFLDLSSHLNVSLNDHLGNLYEGAIDQYMKFIEVLEEEILKKEGGPSFSSRPSWKVLKTMRPKSFMSQTTKLRDFLKAQVYVEGNGMTYFKAQQADIVDGNKYGGWARTFYSVRGQILQGIDSMQEVPAVYGPMIIRTMTEFSRNPLLGLLLNGIQGNTENYSSVSNATFFSESTWNLVVQRAKESVDALGAYGKFHVKMDHLERYEGLQTDLVSEDIVTAYQLMNFGFRTKFIEYFQMGWRTAANLMIYANPSGIKYPAGQVEYQGVYGRAFMRFMLNSNVPVPFKLGIMFNSWFYYKKPIVVATILSVVAIGLLLKWNLFLGMPNPWLWLGIGMFLAETINASAFVRYWEREGFIKGTFVPILMILRHMKMFMPTVLSNTIGIYKGTIAQAKFTETSKTGDVIGEFVPAVLKLGESKFTYNKYGVKEFESGNKGIHTLTAFKSHGVIGAISLLLFFILAPSSLPVLGNFLLYVLALYFWTFSPYIFGAGTELWNRSQRVGLVVLGFVVLLHPHVTHIISGLTGFLALLGIGSQVALNIPLIFNPLITVAVLLAVLFLPPYGGIGRNVMRVYGNLWNRWHRVGLVGLGSVMLLTHFASGVTGIFNPFIAVIMILAGLFLPPYGNIGRNAMKVYKSVLPGSISNTKPSGARLVTLTDSQEAALKEVKAVFGSSVERYVRVSLLFFSRKEISDFKEVDSKYVAEISDDKIFPAVDVNEIKNNQVLIDFAKTAQVEVLSLDGGLGEKLRRSAWKTWLFAKGLISRSEIVPDEMGNPKLGAKGTDMGAFVELNGKIHYLSVSESKLLQLYRQGLDKKFASLSFRPIVNEDSRPSYNALMNKPNVLGLVSSGSSEPMTYGELLKSAGVDVLEFMFQPNVPGLEEVQENEQTILISGISKQALNQSGGHGQIGVEMVANPEDVVLPSGGTRSILAFTNGDNQVASDISSEIVGHILKNNIVIGNLVTAATPVDRKGGKYIVKLVQFLGLSKWIPGQRELTAAKELGKETEERFYAAGQKEGEPIFGASSVGRQPFNTNNFYINQTRLIPFLRDLKAAMGSDQYLAEVISPNFMRKDKKPGKDNRQYYPLDSAIGNVFHNINEFVLRMSLLEQASNQDLVTLSDSQAEILRVIHKHQMDAVIHYYNVPRSMFTPQKNPLDALLQMTGKYYRLDLLSGNLVETQDGLMPGEFVINDSQGNSQDSGKGYYSEFLNMLRTFVSGDSPAEILKSVFDIRKVEKLEIYGNISIPDVVWVGMIKISNSDKSEKVFDLKSALLNDPALKQQVGWVDGQPLVLRDMDININPGGIVSIQSIKRGARLASEAEETTTPSTESTPLTVAFVAMESGLRGAPQAGGQYDYVRDVSTHLGAIDRVFVISPNFLNKDGKRIDPDNKRRVKRVIPVTIPIGRGRVPIEVLEVQEKHVTYFMLHDPSNMFFQQLYESDHGLKGLVEAIVLSRAPFEIQKALRAAGENFKFDVLHANDWQAALVGVYQKNNYEEEFRGTASVFTAHNMAYAGPFNGYLFIESKQDKMLEEYLKRPGIDVIDPARDLETRDGRLLFHVVPDREPPYSKENFLNLPQSLITSTPDGLEYYSKWDTGHKFALLKGMMFFDRFSAVSVGNLNEIVKPGASGVAEGLGGVVWRMLQGEGKSRATAVYNGIDMVSPFKATDSVQEIRNKKLAFKQQLMEKLHLSPETTKTWDDHFFVSMVARLAQQKGWEHLIKVVPDLATQGRFIGPVGQKVRIIAMGDPLGDHDVYGLKLKKDLETLAARYPEYFMYIPFDKGLEDEIYRGSDAFVMPSNHEPGGMANQKAAKNGTIVIASLIGGLVDFFSKLWGGQGYSYSNHDPVKGLAGNISKAAQDYWMNRVSWDKTVRDQTHYKAGWAKRIQAYKEDVYQVALDRVRGTSGARLATETLPVIRSVFWDQNANNRQGAVIFVVESQDSRTPYPMIRQNIIMNNPDEMLTQLNRLKSQGAIRSDVRFERAWRPESASPQQIKIIFESNRIQNGFIHTEQEGWQFPSAILAVLRNNNLLISGTRLADSSPRLADVSKIVVNIRDLNQAAFEAKKAQIVSDLGVNLAGRFDFIFNQEGFTKVAPPTATRDTFFIDNISFTPVVLTQITTALIDRLVMRQRHEVTALNFVRNVLSGEDKAIEILRADLAQIASELAVPEPLRVFDSSTGAVIFSGAVLVDTSSNTLSSISKNLETGLKNSSTPTDTLKRSLSDMLRFVDSLNEATFSQKAEALAQMVRGVENNLFKAVLEGLADSKGEAVVLTDEAVLSKDTDGRYEREMNSLVARLQSKGTQVRNLLMVRTNTDLSDPAAVDLAKQEIMKKRAGYADADIRLVPENVTDLSEVIKLYPELTAMPVVAVSNQNALVASNVMTGGKAAIVLQVHHEAESLGEVPTVAMILRLSEGDVMLPGLEKTAAGIFVIKPLLLVLNDLYKQLKTEQVSIGAAA